MQIHLWTNRLNISFIKAILVIDLNASKRVLSFLNMSSISISLPWSLKYFCRLAQAGSVVKNGRVRFAIAILTLQVVQVVSLSFKWP